MISEMTCKGCGKSVSENMGFCPHCGITLGKLEEEYIYETMDDYASTSRENIDRYLRLLENPEKLEERIQEEKPQIFQKQKQITQKILERFPEIRDHVFENPEVQFEIFIISIPYEKSPNNLQHDCVLRRLASEQNGLVNFSLGSTQIATDLVAFDIPIWAPKKVGHELLFYQKQIIENSLPKSQRKFLYCAEPWWICTKVFDLDGRWVNWRFLFKTEGITEHAQEQKEVPLYFHLFSNMEYSDLFSTAGTSTDGEVLIGLHKMEETEIFKNQLTELEDLYDFGRKPDTETIRISWDTLESLGIIGISAQQLLNSGRGHFFRKTLTQGIIDEVEQKSVLDTKGAVTGGRSLSNDEFSDKVMRKFIWKEKQGYQGGIMKITHGISREYRKKYRVSGDRA